MSYRNEQYICSEGCDLPGTEEIEVDACSKNPGFLSRFQEMCKYKFSGLKIDMSVMFIYLIAIVTAIAVIGFGFGIGTNDYNSLNQPSSEVTPWVVLLVTAFGIIIAAFGSYILHQMTEGILRYMFMLSFLFILILMTIGFVALYLFASPSSAQYISLIAIIVAVWIAVFAGTISYVAAGLFILVALSIGLLFVVAARISAVN